MRPNWLDQSISLGWSDELPRMVELGGVLPPDFGIGGQLKLSPEDFCVDEVPAYEPSGEGEHIYVHVEKVGLTTLEVAKLLAQTVGVKPRDVGYAGMKDKWARTTQWMSIYGPKVDEAPLEALEVEGLKILRMARHANKLKTGHLLGNRFRVCLRDVRTFEGIEEAVTALQKYGFPNYFGPQRFGRSGDNTRSARNRFFADYEPRNRKERRRNARQARLLASAIQSAAFNTCVAARLSLPTWNQPKLGDVLQKTDTNGQFVVSDLAGETERWERGELALTAPLPGPRAKSAEGAPAQLEALIARDVLSGDVDPSLWESLTALGSGDGPTDEASSGEERDSFVAIAGQWGEGLGKLGQGTRRRIFVSQTDLAYKIDREKNAVWFEFELPPGSYATVLLREFQGRGIQ